MKKHFVDYRSSLKFVLTGFLLLGTTQAWAQEQEELVAAEKKPSAEEEAIAAKNYRRDMREEGGQTFYIVNNRAPHLYMISRDLYGSEKYWKELAQWNNLSNPYTLSTGQKLVIKRLPVQSREQGDSELIKSWTALQKWSAVQGILWAQQADRVAQAAPPAPSEEEASVAAVLPVTTEATLPPPVSAEHITAEESHPPASAQIENRIEALSAKEEVGREISSGHAKKKWHWGVGAVVSAFELESSDHAGGVKNYLNSEVDYGVELEAAYALNEQSHLILGVAVEHMDISHSDEVELEGASQDIWKFSLGMETAFSPYFSLAGSLIYEQLPFVTPTGSGAIVDVVYVPQLALGGRWSFWKTERFYAQFSADILLLLPKFEYEHDIKSGEGFLAGVKFHHELQSSVFSYGVAYRYIQQNTTTSDNNQKLILAHFGWEF